MPQMYRRVAALVVSLLLGAAAFQAAAAQDPSAPVPVTNEVREGRLPNGMRPRSGRPRPQGRAELRLVVNAGSILEDDDQLGAAHFIEHMSFNGTRRFPKNELVSYLQSVGVRLGGDLNANTGYDETIYILPIPVGDHHVLETGLAILREWAGNALAQRGGHRHRAGRRARRAAQRRRPPRSGCAARRCRACSTAAGTPTACRSAPAAACAR